MMMRCLLFLAVMLGLGACSLQPLLQIPTTQIADERVAQQRWQLVWGGESRTLDSVVAVDAEGMQVVGTAMGLRLFSLDYDGTRITEGAGPGLPTGLPPSRIINDLLLIFAPAAQLQTTIAAPWQLRMSDNRRELWRNNDLVVTVDYHSPDPWQGKTDLRHLLWNYQLTVDSALAP